MKPFIILSLPVLCFLCISCEKPDGSIHPPGREIFLKDVVVQNLPSPYYHFDYDTSGHVNKVSFASGLQVYEVEYESNRIRQMNNTSVANKDKVLFDYDNQGKVGVIKVTNEAGQELKRSFLTYDANNRLKEMEWEVKAAVGGFALDRTLSFTYHGDGNLLELRDHRHSINGQQPEALYIDRYEKYDDKINIDDFMLLHSSGNHLALMPGVHLQANNPQKLVRTGDGVNYEINYTYTYNDIKSPVQKKGDMLMTNGPQAGQHFEVGTTFSYYE
jgi:hypothetical protein